MTFAQAFPQCWNCPSTQGVQTHHICRGPHRAKAKTEECNLLRLCFRCHAIVDGWPVAKQIALQAVNNPDAYDRVKVNLLRSRQPEAITEAQVRRYAKKIVKTAGNLNAAF